MAKKRIFPTLLGKSKNSKLKVWEIVVHEESANHAVVTVSHGYSDGDSLQQSKREFSSGKNLGKKNETTPYQQALVYAKAAWSKKKDAGYVENESELKEIKFRPMLAHEFTKHKAKVKYPCIVQPKLNGVRCIALLEDGVPCLYSRNGKKHVAVMQHKKLMEELTSVLKDNLILDGELYIPGRMFEEIVSMTKRSDGKEVNKLQYHIFDVVNTAEPLQYRRLRELKFIVPKDSKYLVLVDSQEVENEKAVHTKHWEYVGQGYEGIMIRNYNGFYDVGHRSYDLLKLKNFIDEEFKVSGATTGVDGGVIWICRSPYAKRNDNVFNVKMTGTLQDRIKMWHECHKYFGKSLTVRYQNLSMDGIPIFPVGVVFRDYE